MGGYGVQSANAVETALKILEVTGESAVGYGLEEFSHGPCASLRADVGVFLMHTRAPALARAVEIANAVASTKASIVLISDQLDTEWPGSAPLISVPSISNDLLNLFPTAIVAQLVQYYLAVHKGFNTDINNRDLPELAELPGLLFPPGTH